MLSHEIVSIANPQVSIGDIVGQRATGNLLAALTVHIFLLPWWIAIGLIWNSVGHSTAFAVVVVTYACAAVFGWPLVVVVLIIWWRQGRKNLVRRVVLAAVTLLFPFALLLLFAGRIRRAVLPPKLVTNSN